MPRIRTIKPEIGVHEKLFDLEQEIGLPIRFVWAVLPCHCDREGRFEWRPRKLGVQILPYDQIDFSRVLDALLTRGFVVKYRVVDTWYGVIPTFTKHQVINNREKQSSIPSHEQADEIIDYKNQEDSNATNTRKSHVTDALGTRDQSCKEEGKGREGKGKEGKGSCAEQKTCSTPPVITLTLNTGDEYPITQNQIDEWKQLYPSVDVLQALRKMRGWLNANPKKRKTKNGILRFVNSWLSREQDRGGQNGSYKQSHQDAFSTETVDAFK